VKNEVVELYNLISSDINVDETIFANIIKTRYGYSDFFLHIFINENDLFGISYKTFNKDDFNTAKIIVLVDDITSSGDSIIRSLNKLKSQVDLEEKKVIIISLFST